MAQNPVFLTGKGVIIADGVPLREFAEVGFTISREALEIPKGYEDGNWSIPLDRTFSMKVGWKALTPDILPLIAGATLSTGMYEYINEEEITVPSTPFQQTLAKEAVDGTDAIKYADGSGVMKRVSGTPSSAGEYKIETSAGTTTITFHADDEGKKVIASYIHHDTTAGKTATIDKTPSQQSFEVFGVLRPYKYMAGEYAKSFTIRAKNCIITGDTDFGTTVGDSVTFAFDVAINGDIELTMEE